MSNSHDDHSRLPLRWLTILAIAGAAGGLVAFIAGPVAGAATAIAVTGLLDQVTGERAGGQSSGDLPAVSVPVYAWSCIGQARRRIVRS